MAPNTLVVGAWGWQVGDGRSQGGITDGGHDVLCNVVGAAHEAGSGFRVQGLAVSLQLGVRARGRQVLARQRG